MEREGEQGKASESVEAVSAQIKELAARQPIRIEVTAEQFEAILGRWDDADPRAPAEITFYVGERPSGSIAVAGYRYISDTCCV